MARGGKREGAGRRKGALSKKTREIVEAIALNGDETPLEYMLRVMRECTDQKRKDAMAIAAAPFCHPRLATIEANVKVSEHEQAVRSLAAVATIDEHDRPN